MGYCGFKQRSIWLGVEIRAYCVPLSKQSYNGLLRLLTSNKQYFLCKHDILKPLKPEACMLIIICLFIDSFYVMLLKEHRNTQYMKGIELRYTDRTVNDYWHMPR